MSGNDQGPEQRSAQRLEQFVLPARAQPGLPGPGQALGAHSLVPVYDHDPEDVAALGWEEFIARQWESIFAGYRSKTGLRKLGRRWSDLLEAGLGCSQDEADQLVRTEIIDRPDRDLESITDADGLVTGMLAVLADVRTDLLSEDGAPGLLEAHTRLLSFVRGYALGIDAAEPAG
ncbi:MAG: hypothetical protein J2P30_17135 [Actinobacteria bacterium]|nr:hypothetical protein [Actinomycetota bacterium]